MFSWLGSGIWFCLAHHNVHLLDLPADGRRVLSPVALGSVNVVPDFYVGAVLGQVAVDGLAPGRVEVGQEVLRRARVQVRDVLVLAEVHYRRDQLVALLPEIGVDGVDRQEVETVPQLRELLLAHVRACLAHAAL